MYKEQIVSMNPATKEEIGRVDYYGDGKAS